MVSMRNCIVGLFETLWYIDGGVYPVEIDVGSESCALCFCPSVPCIVKLCLSEVSDEREQYIKLVQMRL